MVSSIIFQSFKYVVFIAISYVLLYPFIYVCVNAFKSFYDAYDVTVNWVPKTIDFSNLALAVKVLDLWKSLGNTFFYLIASAMIEFFSCAVAAYGLSRFKLYGKGIMTTMLILNILVPSMMIITPSYVNFSSADFLGILGLVSKIIGQDIRPNLIGTPWVFYLPSLCAVGLRGGLFVYIFSQFYKSMPKELEEAASIDGAGVWKTFLQIVIPSSGSAMITVLLFSIVWHWNEYYLPQMYLDEQTLSVAINTFDANTVTNVLGLDTSNAIMMSRQILFAGCLICVLPLLIFYLLIQKKFVASIATSGIVG